MVTGSVGRWSFPGFLDCQDFPVKEGGAAFPVCRHRLVVTGQAKAKTFALPGFSAQLQGFTQAGLSSEVEFLCLLTAGNQPGHFFDEFRSVELAAVGAEMNRWAVAHQLGGLPDAQPQIHPQAQCEGMAQAVSG